MDFQKFFQSKGFQYALYAIGALLLLLIVFKVGELVGFKKAGFSYEFGEHYYRSFFGPMHGPLHGFMGDDFLMGHGTSGRVVSIASSSIVVNNQGDIEKTILIGGNTVIKRFRDTISISDLKTMDWVIVIGSPNSNGQINAELIRVLPGTSSSTSSVNTRGAQWL